MAPATVIYTGCTVLVLYAWQVGSQVLTVKVLSYTLKSVQPVLPYTCMSLSEHLDCSSRSCGQGPFGRQQNLHSQNQKWLRTFCLLCPCQSSLSVADHIPLILVQSFSIRNPSSAMCKEVNSHTKSSILSPTAKVTNLSLQVTKIFLCHRSTPSAIMLFFFLTVFIINFFPCTLTIISLPKSLSD